MSEKVYMSMTNGKLKLDYEFVDEFVGMTLSAKQTKDLFLFLKSFFENGN